VTAIDQVRSVIRVYASREQAASDTAGELADAAQSGALKALGVATGSSPSAVYAAMAARRLPAFEKLTLFALDEYVGLPADHPERYSAVVARDLARPLRIPERRVHLPSPDDPEAYERMIRAAGGIDIQLLGIGQNGHVGFNEPGSAFGSRTRIVKLEASTRRANSRFFDSLNDVPNRAVTQGIGTILEARRIVLLAFGDDKRDAVEAALLGPVSEEMPASALRSHPDVTWVLDRSAAGAIRKSL
jgi:glucosamine-6-phosphate deaminase